MSTNLDAILPHRRTRWAVYAGLYLAFWTTLGLFNAGQSYLIRASVGKPIELWNALVLGVADWYMWAALAPAIFFVARRLPFDHRSWPSSLTLHVAFNLVCMLVIQVLMVPIWMHYAPPEVTTAAAPPAQPAAEQVPDTATVSPPLPGEPRRPQVELRKSAPLAPPPPPPAQKTFLEVFRLHFIAELVFYFWVYWGIVGISVALDYYRKYRERQQRASQLEGQLARAQLQMLKMQLHPHFLFNTLNAISALMHRDVELADRMVARLGELLRTTLENAGTQEVPLRQELDFIRPYLEIEQARFGDRLDVRLEDIDPETMDAYVPNLILQPLVENAIRHGIASRPEGGAIEVRAWVEAGRLRLEVKDDGPGLSAEQQTDFRPGVGIANTRARLQQLYGTDHQFEMRNGNGCGLTVSLLLPFREQVSRPAERAESDLQENLVS